jgi:hypothetical protein
VGQLKIEEARMMKCKNCGHEIRGIYKRRISKALNLKQGYFHYCHKTHSPQSNRQSQGHSSFVCCECGCKKPEREDKDAKTD